MSATNHRASTILTEASTLEKTRFDAIIEQYGSYLTQNIAQIPNLDIGFGKLGYAWFFLQKHFYQNDPVSLSHFFNIFDSCLSDLNTRDDIEQIYIECTELAFFINHYEWFLKKHHYDTEQFLASLEDILIPYTEQQLKRQHFDPYLGAFFPAYYFLVTGKQPKLIEQCILAIDQNKKLGEIGGAFLFNPQMGYASLGLTHGLAFYILFLSKAVEHDILPSKCFSLIHQFVEFIKINKYSAQNSGCFFPDVLGKNNRTRLSLTYGDLGILFALLRAAETLQDEKLYDETIEMLKTSAKRRTYEDTGIAGNGLLYGRLGVSIFFKRMSTWTSNKVFKEASDHWYASYKTKFNTEISSLEPIQNYTYKTMKTHSFYEGLTGILGTDMAIKAKKEQLKFLFYMC